MNFICKIKIVFLLSGVFTFQTIWSQDVKVEAKLDSLVIEIGDQVLLNLTTDQPQTEIVNFPEIKDTIINGIDVVELSELDTQTVNNRILITQKVLITAFEDSVFKIPPFVFRHNNDTLFTEALYLSVDNIQLDSTEFAKIDTSQMLQVFDVKEPINTPWTFKEFIQLYYWVFLIILGVGILVTLIVILIVRLSKDKPLLKRPEKPKEPAHIIALRELDALKQKKLWQGGKEKQYYSELTEIIREYIENRYNIPTFERTSHELLDAIRYQKIMEDSLYNQLQQILTLADLAKFAKFKPLPDENDKCLKDSYYLVEQTKLVVKKPQTEEKNTEIQIKTEKKIDEKNSD